MKNIVKCPQCRALVWVEFAIEQEYCKICKSHFLKPCPHGRWRFISGTCFFCRHVLLRRREGGEDWEFFLVN